MSAETQNVSTVQAPPRRITEAIASKFMVTPQNIAYAVFPIVQAMHLLKPDYAVP